MVALAISGKPRILVSVTLPGDARSVARFARRLSRRSVRARFLRHCTPSEKTIAITARDRDAGVVVGHAVALRVNAEAASVALAVAEAYAPFDVAAQLLEALAAEARKRGIIVLCRDGLLCCRDDGCCTQETP
jgi:GNAT superfamily N-acetyltransferase